MENNLSQTLQKRWVHSHEEDTATAMVFRPATFPFPRSRGRTAFELKPDHSLVESNISPTDGPQPSQGAWQLNEKNELVFSKDLSSPPTRVLQIVSADADRLVLSK